MPVTVDGFLKNLSDSGVLSNSDFVVLQLNIPAEKRAQDADPLARELVRLKKLTEFQAGVLYDEKPKPLILGNYVIEDEIGTGGMGVVYKARHRRMKRVVAIKVLSPSAIQSTSLVKRFLREAETAAKLTHPNIVAAFDADEINGIPFLAMEYVDGVDLSVHVKQNGPLNIDKAIDCVIQAARGLEHAHLQGIVHRDIKPANILLDSRGTVKILDMGLARIQDGSNPISAAEAAETIEVATITQTGSIVGTVDFMSPEQALDSSAADHSSDIYSLGATFYYLLVGKPMYESDNLMDRILAHREAPRPSICAARKDVPPQIDTVFYRMVARSRNDRYASTTNLIRDLTNWRSLPVVDPNSFKAKFLSDPMSAMFDSE